MMFSVVMFRASNAEAGPWPSVLVAVRTARQVGRFQRPCVRRPRGDLRAWRARGSVAAPGAYARLWATP
ncbi:MAG: hypothetical protein ACK52I_02395, partial [Pseudomonadota bacterium]